MPWKRTAILLVIATLATVASASRASAQNAGGQTDADVEPEIPTATVEVDGQMLFRVRGVSAAPADQRAAKIAGRIVALARDPAFRIESLRPVESDLGIKLMAGDDLVLQVFEADARLEKVRLPVLAAANLQRIKAAIEEYRGARRPERLLTHAVFALAATLALAVVIAVVLWFARWFDARVERRLHSRIESLEAQSLKVLRAERISSALRALLRTLRMTAILVATIVYLRLVLGLFPWTRGVGLRLVEFVLGPLTLMGQAVLRSIPNLIILAILFFIVRFVLQLLHAFFDAVGRGSVTLAGFEAEWAAPTYRLARLLVIAFGLVVAYPYIPGSESAAFKGVSVFLGVVFSLGSSSTIANAIAGYSLTYRRAFKLGDRVRIGDTVGDVVEMRLQVTHLRSLKHEEVIIPNSLILSSQVLNYSSLAREEGLILHTTVGIGYETPWRQVEAMLLMAAERTTGLSKAPGPFVLHQSLADFAVNYELNVYCADAQQMQPLYTALHRNILDVFNEYGVQIMTPAYESDPAEAKVVRKDQWYAPPAAPAGREP